MNNNMNMNNNMMNNNMMNNSIDSLTNSFSNMNLANSAFLNNNFNTPMYSNLNINPPLMRRHSDNIMNNINSEITMKFTFMGGQVFLVKGKPSEKFIDVVNRFKDTQCPQPLKNNLSIPVHTGLKVKKEKTLSELSIRDGDIVLFINKTSNEDEDEDRELTPEEKEKIDKLIQALADMYVFLKMLEEMEKNGQNPNGSVIKEHAGLVYSITLFDWTCNICKKKYSKNNPRYYCSVCDYNMCNACYTQRNYPKKKEFPAQVAPTIPNIREKYFDTAYHRHKLVYCRTSRNNEQLNSWICDNCRENHNNEEWSFYCTKCDFDLCSSCMGK
jgi:hypothetical protein